ncbi:Na(+)/H(+) antiporter subunit C [Streptomyces sp. FR-008]|uniref:Na(+)/H(+) antiporter subunit C n=1 Tax=Streptomyces sp. FR-008 TaxID=206662 RepID=UPI0007229C6E|nr:NADH-ubiquinone oxidoreductase chain 4L [Streptomyces sp. FR-008]
MTISLALLVTATVLIAVGGVLLLTRPLTRILLGAVITSNGINLLLLAVTGLSGPAPLLYPGVDPASVTDPLPQAITLTAIVITLATTAFILAMAYRSYQLTGTDEVHDDIEDRRVALRSEVYDRRSELRSRYREADRDPEVRRRYRAERRQLSARLRADRALQARGRDASGDLWNDILGADPADYPQGPENGEEGGPETPGPGGTGPSGPDTGPSGAPDTSAPTNRPPPRRTRRHRPGGPESTGPQATDTTTRPEPPTPAATPPGPGRHPGPPGRDPGPRRRQRGHRDPAAPRRTAPDAQHPPEDPVPDGHPEAVRRRPRPQDHPAPDPHPGPAPYPSTPPGPESVRKPYPRPGRADRPQPPGDLR